MLIVIYMIIKQFIKQNGIKMSIQKTQPSFTGNIESLKRINMMNEIVPKPITQEENKLLRPL